MRIIFAPQAQEDYNYWKKSGNKSVFDKINRLLVDISEHPYIGIGKPEPLRYELAGKWSRRITSERRVIYSVREDIMEIYIFSIRYHYSKVE
jgi:toxin YoeB